MIKYRITDFIFDMDKFGYDLRRCAFVSDSQLEALLSVDRTTIINWKSGAYQRASDTPHPNMRNFLKVCNLLDLDPRDYFILARDIGHE